MHYGEVGLKKGNRPYFETRLVRNLHYTLRGLRVMGIHRIYGRLRIDQELDGDRGELLRRLSRVHGVSHVLPIERFGWDLGPIEARLAEWAGEGGFESFAIRCRRIQKSYPHRSQDLMVRLGAIVGERSGARVDLRAPEVEFSVLILNREVILSRERISGPGGLPTGTAGRVLHMLSGGIDSPVAAERLLRRGCHLQFVHFHSSPFTDRSSIEKTTELANILTRHRMRSKLHLVPLGLLQQRIVQDAPARWRVMLYRRSMLRIAARIAGWNQCKALGSGENLAQVASQTLENLAVLDETVALPLLRPLLSYDKEEIVEEARRIGTYEVSTEPHADCCGYLLPRRPVTDGTVEEVREIEAALDLSEELEEVHSRTEVVTLPDLDREPPGEE